ncbi:hypothetical protein [Phocaeicola sp.]
MTQEEFINCKIGDNIFTTTGKVRPIEDIDRSKGKITTGNGQWRDYRSVKLPLSNTVFESIETAKKGNVSFVPSDIVVLSRKELLKYGFPRVIIMRAIESAGPNGFIGSNENLAARTEFISYDYTRNLSRKMVKEGLIDKECLKRGMYRFTLKKI